MRRRSRCRFFVLAGVMGVLGLVLGLWSVGCRRGAGDDPACPARSESSSISLFCGAALRPLAESLAAEYQRRTGVSVKMTYGGSTLLMSQLELVPGEADLFLPGDAWYVEEAAERGWIEEVVPLARMVPAILVQEGNPLGIRSMRDLARPGIRLAMPDSRGPALARLVPELLQVAGVSEGAIASNVVFTAATLPELAHAVRLGHADATVVWEFYARLQAPCETVILPAEENRTVSLSIGLMRASSRKEEARRFVKFITSEEARSIWRDCHFQINP